MAKKKAALPRERTFGSIRYKLVRNGAASKKAGHDVFSAAILNKEAYGAQQIAERLAAGNSLLSKSAIKFVLEELGELIPELVAEGRTVNLGHFVRFMPAIQGTFDTPDEPFNPRKHTVLVKTCSCRKMLKQLGPRPTSRIGRTPRPTLTILINAVTHVLNSVSSDGAFNVVGKHLSWDLNAADEGWFMVYNGLERKCTCESGPVEDLPVRLISPFAFNAPGEPLELIFRTRLGGSILRRVVYRNPVVTA